MHTPRQSPAANLPVAVLLGPALRGAVLAGAILCSLSTAAPQTCGAWQDLGTFGGARAFASSASADAGVIVGSATDPLGRNGAFRWTAAGGLQYLGTLGGNESAAYGVSADGSVVVGWALDLFQDDRAFRWTDATGMQDLGVLPGCTRAMANAVSADGNVVVGFSDQGLWQTALAFHWTAAGGMQSIGTLPADISSHAFGTSADGSFVVGISSSDAYNRAFRWSAATGMQDLGGMPGYPHHEASGISADGRVVIGDSNSGPGTGRAFRWTDTTGIEPLADTTTETIAFGMSADGRFIVGWEAFRWTAPTGIERLSATGVHGSVFDISDDGRIVVGSAYNAGGYNRAFRLELSALGATYCGPPIANSTGCGSRLFVSGSGLAAANDLQISARYMPLDTFGYFLTSRDPGDLFPVSLSQGRLCLSGSIGRFRGPSEVQNSGTAGVFALAVDLTALPTPTGPTAVQPGESWYFQAWHRDSNPATTSNFTDAVRVRFE